MAEKKKTITDSTDCFRAPTRRTYNETLKIITPFLLGVVLSGTAAWLSLVREIPTRVEVAEIVNGKLETLKGSYSTEKEIEELLYKKSPYIVDKARIDERIRENREDIRQLNENQNLILRKLDVVINNLERIEKRR